MYSIHIRRELTQATSPESNMTTLTLPPMPSGLSPEWLTSCLTASGITGGARVVAAERSSVGEGVGMMSELSRLRLTWSESRPDLPASLIAKYASTNPVNRAAANGFHVYEREVRFFLEVDTRTTMRTPRCYFARLEPDNYLLLMEDLGEYRIGSQAAGAGREDTELAIDQLARLHAPFWERTQDLDWVPHIHGSYHAEGLVMMATNGWDPMVRHFGAHIPESVRAGRDAVLAAIPAMQAQMNVKPITLVHGDFRMDNVLFGQKTGQDPIVILDWQGPLKAKSIVDVAVLLGQNTHTDVRRTHERALIERYVSGLASLGVQYPFESAWEDYLDALLYQWCYCATITGSLDGSNPASAAWMAQCAARQSAVTVDHNLYSRLGRFR
jgi:aminoglycoside/choline kinase family phosphotransferase